MDKLETITKEELLALIDEEDRISEQYLEFMLMKLKRSDSRNYEKAVSWLFSL